MERVTVLGQLAQLCEVAKVLVGGRGSSININTDNSSRLILAATDDIAAQLENLQEVVGEGPYRQAFRTGEPVVTDLRDAASRLWPAFTPAAAEIIPDATIYCYPIRADGRPFGVFSVYTTKALTEPREILQLLADAAGVAVLHDPAIDAFDDVWASPAAVHQATGMVMAQLRLSAVDALATLRARAFASGTALREIAEQIVNRRLDFSR